MEEIIALILFIILAIMVGVLIKTIKDSNK